MKLAIELQPLFFIPYIYHIYLSLTTSGLSAFKKGYRLLKTRLLYQGAVLVRKQPFLFAKEPHLGTNNAYFYIADFFIVFFVGWGGYLGWTACFGVFSGE